MSDPIARQIAERLADMLTCETEYATEAIASTPAYRELVEAAQAMTGAWFPNAEQHLNARNRLRRALGGKP